MFNVLTDDGFFRATRLPGQNINMFTLMLIDTGEKFKMEFTHVPFESFFVMPEELQKVPGLAIKCQVNDSYVDDHESAGPFDFHIIDNLGSALVVDIYPKFDSDEEVSDVDLSLTDDELNEEDEWFSGEETSLEEVLKQDVIAAVTTDDPYQAVMGFSAEDENICPFYNPEIGGCFKGAYCTQRHEFHDTAAPVDKASVYFFDKCPAIIQSDEIPCKQFTVEITEFVSVNQFVCCMADARKSMSKVVDLLNQSNFTFTRLSQFPAPRQLVVVESTNGAFLRARVEADVDEQGKVHVLLLDLGKFDIVDEAQLYEWQEPLQEMAISIVEMEIANIMPAQDEAKSAEALELLRIHQEEVDALFKIQIVDNVNGIKCILRDCCNGDDIGLELANNGLALERQFEQSIAESRRFILG